MIPATGTNLQAGGNVPRGLLDTRQACQHPGTSWLGGQGPSAGRFPAAISG